MQRVTTTAKRLEYARPASQYYRARRVVPRWMISICSINLIAGIVCFFGTWTRVSWGRLDFVAMIDPVTFLAQLLIAGVALGFVLPGQRTRWNLLAIGPAITLAGFALGFLLPGSGGC